MKLNLNKPLVFFDLETTGINIGTDRIVEICVLKVQPDGSEEIRTWLVNPTIPIPPQVTLIHGIKNEDVADKPTFKELAHEIATFIGSADLAGFNSNKFDIPLLVEEFLRTDVEFDLKNRRFVDIQNIFHKMEPRNLKAAYKFYCNADLENAHTAEADTRATYEILKAQIKRYQNTTIISNKGNETTPIVNDVKALHEFSFQTSNVDLVGHIIYNEKKVEIFNFGKYKGKSVEQVFTQEPAYYDWMMKADFPLSTKKIITAIKLRGFNKNSVNINK